MSSRADWLCSPGLPTVILNRAVLGTATYHRGLHTGVQGEREPGGGRSYQGRDTTSFTTISRRWDRLFFGRISSGSVRGALPFSAAENLCIGAMTAQARNGARKEKKREMKRRDG